VLNHEGLKRKLKNIKIPLGRLERVADFNKYVKFLPFSTFYFNDLLKYSPELETFLRLNGELVNSLKMFQVKEGLSDFQFEFLNSLPNIKHLEIAMSFHDIKEIKILLHKSVPACMANLESFQYTYPFEWSNVDYLYKDHTNINKLTIRKSDFCEEDWDDFYGDYGDGLLHFLKKRFEENNPNTLEIKFDGESELKYYFFPLSKINEFWDFVMKLQGKVKLYHVNASDISDLVSDSEKGQRSPQELSTLLNSFKSVEWILDEGVFLPDLPLVETLKLYLFDSVNATPNTSHFKIKKNSKQPWLENLKEINAHLSYLEDGNEECIKTVSNLIFDRRPLVTRLDINCSSSLEREGLRLFFKPSCLCYFNNLKRLRLDCKFEQGDYIELLSVLTSNTKLERFTAKIHSDIDDDFFYGNDRNNPVWLQMSSKCAR